MDIFQAIILGIVEGITEFLPISSTGHLILVSKLLNIPQTDFVKSFEVIIQTGAIAAVVVLYSKKLLVDRDLLKKVLAAFIPTGIIGFTLYRMVKDVLIGNVYITLISLFIGGIALIIFEKYFAKEKANIQQTSTTDYSLTYLQASTIGLFQSISMIPGISRSAATIIGGFTVGLDRKKAVEFSFLLAIPTMIAATGCDLLKSYNSFSSTDITIIAAGWITSFIVALIVIKLFIAFIQRFSLISFGVYRILLAIIYYLLIVNS